MNFIENQDIVKKRDECINTEDDAIQHRRCLYNPRGCLYQYPSIYSFQLPIAVSTIAQTIATFPFLATADLLAGLSVPFMRDLDGHALLDALCCELR